MKKSLIALAVLAASGAAMAQSNVQLYGIVDLWTGGLKSSETSANPTRVTKLDSGGLSSSRWGLKGTEDLGGGLKAGFQLEQGFKADTGAANGGFDRVAALSLSGGFGTVSLGNQWTAFDDVLGASNSVFDSALSPTQGVWLVPNLYADSPNNTFKYTSPNFGGFTFAATYSLDEDKTKKNDIYDISLSYATGPLAVNFAYQVQNDTTDAKLTTLNGSYDFGAAKLLASYGQYKKGADDANEYQIGVDVPLSSNLIVSAGYAHSKRDAALSSLSGTFYGRTNKGFGVGLAYMMSKRTTVYAGVSSAKGENAAGVDVSKRQLYAVGLKHTF